MGPPLSGDPATAAGAAPAPAPAPAAAGAAPGAATAATPGPGSSSSLLATVQALWRDLPGLLNDRVELLSLELQRAGAALVQIVVLLIAAAILIVTAWLVLWGGVAFGLVALGLHPALASLLVLGLNLGAAVGAAWRVRHLLPQLALPATRRHFHIVPSARPSTGAAPTPPPRHEQPPPDAAPAPL